MNIQSLLDPTFLFDSLPVRESRIYLPLLIFFGLIIILAVAVKIFEKKVGKLISSYFYLFLLTGFIGLVNLFSRYEGLPWLGSRIILLADFLALIIGCVINVVIAFKQIPKIKQEKMTEDRFNKYLPRSKRNL